MTDNINAMHLDELIASHELQLDQLNEDLLINKII